MPSWPCPFCALSTGSASEGRRPDLTSMVLGWPPRRTPRRRVSPLWEAATWRVNSVAPRTIVPLTDSTTSPALAARPCRRRTAGAQFVHQRLALHVGLAQALGDLRRHVLDHRAQIAAGDLAAGDQLLGDVVGDIGRNGEADAHRAARGREDGRVDPDHPAVDVEGRAAGIAPVDGRVDLDVVDELLADVAPVGRDDAGCGRAAQAEGVAHRDHPVAHARGLRGVLEIDDTGRARPRP